jgi:peptide/nickel transport system ATP-binding protein
MIQSMPACAKPGYAPAVIRVRGLAVNHRSRSGPPVRALSGIDFEIRRGEIVGILGESGSGKSTLALSMLGLLPESAEVAGSIWFDETNLLQLDEQEWRVVRGRQIAMIFQAPGLSLSPVMRVGEQIAEVLRAHQRAEGNRGRSQVEALLRDVGFTDVDRTYRAYPHQLSGGELHRIAIAQALACAPEVMIADEPTQSLDAAKQNEILDLLRDLNRKIGCTLIFITHNPALLSGFADRVMVMYAGHIVEEGPVRSIFRQALHPYTQGLLQLAPSSLQNQDRSGGRRLPAIPGNLSLADHHSPGCIFAPRCSARTRICESDSPIVVVPEEGRRVTCFNYAH